MAIYDSNGSALGAAYDTNGNSLAAAYDVNGNNILTTSNELRVMTYNVQWFEGLNAIQEMQDLIISTYQPDIIGLQEVFRHRSDIPPVGSEMLKDYRYLYLSKTTNPDGVASKFPLKNVVMEKFTNQDPSDVSNSDERGYIKAYFRFGNANICWLNAHLAYITPEYKHLQMMELFEMAEQEEYCILTGDFNAYGTEADFNGMFKPFLDANYHLANFIASNNFTKTWGDSKTATSTEDLTQPTDNIICSENIAIDSVVFSPIKFEYVNGTDAIDHIPVFCVLNIN